MRTKISSRSAILAAMENMGLEGRTNLIPMFKSWATRAEKFIVGPGIVTNARRKIYVLDVVNCSADLPCEALSIQNIVTGDHGCECDALMDQVGFFYYDAFMINSIVVSDPRYYVVDAVRMSRLPITYTVQDNKIVFNCSDLDGQKITVAMLVLEMCENGFIKVNEGHLEAIGSFVEWRWMKRARHKATERRYSKSEIDDQYREFIRFSNYANGEDGRAEPHQEYMLAEMVHDQYSGLHRRSINSFYYYF